MRGLRAVLAIVIAVVWGVFVPAAMAADHCAAMNYMCEGPCGASAPAAAPDVPAFTDLVSDAVAGPAPVVPQSERSALEPPPRPLVLSA